VVNTLSRLIGVWGICAMMAGLLAAPPVGAQTASQQGRDQGQYVPGIWVDPDGCEHWVMDDGAEGFMSPHLTRDGKPVCRGGNICGVLNSDQFFATNSFRLGTSAQERLAAFFQNEKARSFVITGHTDSRASDSYNMRLSLNRANAVAAIARANGGNVSNVRGYGERKPIATNATAAGRAQNRRVEILCVR